jgi:hypothetical protein
MTARTPVRPAYVVRTAGGHGVSQGVPPRTFWSLSPSPHAFLTQTTDHRGVAELRTRWRSYAYAACDPLVVGAVALLAYALHGYQGILDRDLGVFVYGGEHVAQGVPPYVGVFNTVGPLSDAVPGIAIWVGHLFGLDPILSARVFFTVISAACCALLCVLARDVFGSRPASYLAPAVFLNFQRFTELATDGPREKTTMVLFLVAGLILVCRRRWVGAGVCTALATLTWQPSFAVAVAAVAVAVFVGVDRRGRALLLFLLGGAIPTLVTIVYFTSQHALHQAFEGFVVVNVLYTSQPSVLSAPLRIWRFLWAGYHVSLLVDLVGIGVLVAMAAPVASRLLRRTTPRSQRPPRDIALVSVAAAAFVGVVWSMGAINGAPDLFELLPFGALGAAGGVLWLVRRIADGRSGVVAAVTAAAVVTAVAGSALNRNELLPIQRTDIARVLAAAPPGASLLSISAPEVLAITGRTNPTPFQIYDRQIEAYLARSWPGGLTGYAHDLARLRPTLIVLGDSYTRTWPDHLLSTYYWPFGRGTSWHWYASRTVGQRELARLRAANASVRGDRRAGRIG